MSDIFLSYTREDRETAKRIAEALERRGYSVWWDRIIPPGKMYDKFIEENLNAAKCVLVLWSRGSAISDWVNDEASEGLRRRILIPVLIEDTEIPLGFRRVQAANLIHWQGTAPYPEFDLLLKSVGEIVGKLPVDLRESKKGQKRQIAEAKHKKAEIPRLKRGPTFPEPTLRQIDHTPFMGPVRDQGNEGSIVGFAVAAALEYQIYSALAERVMISPRYLYYFAKLEGNLDPHSDTGAWIKDAVKVLKRSGAVVEEVWPYKPGDLKAKPPKKIETGKKYKITKSFQLTTVDEMKSALQSRGPIVVGITLHESIYTASKTGIVPAPATSEKEIGMIAVCLVGYDDHKKLFKFKHAWGTKWGEKGYGYLSYEYIKKFSADSWSFWI
jgi:hypothetical protein